MKKATKLAMIGSGIILLIEILYKIMYFLDFQINQQFYQIISFFQMIAPITIFNFFVILYKKQIYRYRIIILFVRHLLIQKVNNFRNTCQSENCSMIFDIL